MNADLQRLREARRHDDVLGDQRHCFQRDRDRILYSSAFRRLAGVSQVVRANEADVFHNRLAHTIKVAQIGRRLAQHIKQQQFELAEELGVDEEVVEGACLAHDLGHPPFGHVGEEELDELVTEGDHGSDGYEGNAQSFRIVTQLAVRLPDSDGLNLTRATLAATLKYPWLRDRDNPSRAKKWSSYVSEIADFEFASELHRRTGAAKTAEAELMEWADDIAYSVHDLEDFHRCGLIPWNWIRLDLEADEGDAFRSGICQKLVDGAAERWYGAPVNASRLLAAELENVVKNLPNGMVDPYEGTRDQRQSLRFWTSNQIKYFFESIRLISPHPHGEPCVEIDPQAQARVFILKQLTWRFAIGLPALAAQQRGQRRILRDLFEDLLADIKEDRPPRYLPIRSRDLLRTGKASPARIVADCISSLTESEAVALHARLRGISGGSVLDPIVR